MSTSTGEQRRAYSIARAMARTRIGLAPPRQEISDRIDAVGWRRVRPVIWRAMGPPVQRQGLWSLGKRDTAKVLAALRSMPRQRSLWKQYGSPEEP
jgi:hypothetical protein